MRESTSNLIISSKKAFSLMEILIVLALIALIAGLTITNLDKLLGGSNDQVAKLYVTETIKTPLMTYRIHVGSYPSSADGLNALVQAPQGKEKRWKGPYVDKLPEDPWGNIYQYRYPGVRNPAKYDVWSFGADGVESDDDIGNW